MITEELSRAIFAGNAVLFLGAGASKESGGPIGSTLAEYIAENLDIDEDTSDLAVLSQIIIKKKLGTRKEIEECVKRRLEKLEPSQGYLDMAHLPWKSIFSVNYDNLVEQSYKKAKGLYDLKVVNSYNIYDDREKNQISLFKLNGNIDDVYSPNKPLLITYDDLIDKDSFKSEMIKRLVASLQHTLIFVGYGFADKVLEDILRELKQSDNYDSIKRKYVIAPNEDKAHISKLSALYDCEYIDSTAEKFFSELKTKFEKDYQAKLAAYGKSLSFFSGEDKISFPPSLKFVLESYFDYYDEAVEYPNDPHYYYRCGNPSWGNIKCHLDVNRDVYLESNSEQRNIAIVDAIDTIYNKLNEKSFSLIKLEGPIAVGKTTFCYRMAYELYYKGVLSLFVKDTESMKRNLLTEIYNTLEKPFVVFIDNALNHISKINLMINECAENNLPILICVVMRENDVFLAQDMKLGKRLEKVDFTLRMKDQLNEQQSRELAQKLISNKLLELSSEVTQKDIIDIFLKQKNIVASLMEAIEGTNFKRKIVIDFERVSVETQRAYAMIALVNRLRFPFKWEILQRSLEKEYDMDWEMFIDKVVRGEGKGNIIEQGEEDRLFYVCRHSLVAEVIVEVFYKREYKDEISIYKQIINSITPGSNEELFIGRIIRNIIANRKDLNYQDEQVLELINEALKVIQNPFYLLHVKGQFLMDNLKQYEEALSCFDKCIKNKQNREYALHSSAMAHFYMSQENGITNIMYQYEVNETKKYLEKGLDEFADNSYFYRTYFQVILSELQQGARDELYQKAEQLYKIGREKFNDDEEFDTYYKKIQAFQCQS